MKRNSNKTIKELNQELLSLRQKVIALESQNLFYRQEIDQMNSHSTNNKVNFSKPFVDSSIPCGLWQYYGETIKNLYKQIEDLLINIEVTSLKDSQCTYKENETLSLANLFENVLEGVLITDNNAKVIYANNVAYNVLEFTKADILGQCYYKVLFNQNSLASPCQSHYLNKNLFNNSLALSGQPHHFNEVQNKSYNIEFCTRSNRKLLLNILITSLQKMHPYSSFLLIVFSSLEKETSNSFRPLTKAIQPQESDQTDSSFQEKILTSREKEILVLLSNGVNTKQIAKQLFISIATVRNHISSIFRKLTVSNRLEAVTYAKNRYLI